MANDSFDSRDLQRAMRSLRDVINGGTGATDDNSRAGDKAVKNQPKDMGKRAAKTAKESSDTVLALKAAVLDTGGALAKFALKVKNSGDIDALEEVIDGVAKAAGEFKTETDEYGNKVKKSGKETYDKLGGMGKATNMMIGGVEMTAEASKFLLKRLKEQRDMFYELSSSGVIGAGGMSEMQDMWLQSGLKSENWKKLLVGSSESLAQMGGIASENTGKLSKAMNDLFLQNKEFRNIGQTQESMVATASKALDIEVRTGRAPRTQQEITDTIARYTNQLDILARVTGKSQDQAMSAIDEIRSDPQWNAWRDQQLQTGERSEAELNEMELFLADATMKNKNIGDGYKDLLIHKGAPMTAQGEALKRDSMGTMKVFSQKTAPAMMAAALEEAKNAKSRGKGFQYALDEADNATVTLVDLNEFTTQTADAMGQAQEDQNKLKAGADKQTDATFEAQQNMDKMYINTNKQITEFLPKFADLTNTTAQGMSLLADNVVELGKHLGIAMDVTKKGVQRAVEVVSDTVQNTFGGGGGGGGGKSVLAQATLMLGKNEAQNGKELNDWMNEHSGTKASSIATAWCARFVNSVLDTQGVKGTGNASAASFKTWGNEVWSQGQDKAGLGKVQAGDVITMAAPTQSGSHVAIVRGIDEKTGKILTIGGNQSDAVTQGAVDVSRVQSIRRAPGMPSAPSPTTSMASAQPAATSLATPGAKSTTTPTQYAQAPTGSTAAPSVTTPKTNYDQPVVNSPTPNQASLKPEDASSTMTVTLSQLLQETLSHTNALGASIDGASKNMMTLAANAKDASKAIK